VYGPRRQRHARTRAGEARSGPEPARDRSDAAQSASAADEPRRLTARAIARALGRAGIVAEVMSGIFRVTD
jgi:hypothetical protein